MATLRFVKANEEIADAVVSSYRKIEEGVVGAYQKVEDGFVDKFLLHEGESVEDAKKRLAEEQSAREQAAERRITAHPAGIGGTDIGRASVEASREIGRASVEASKNAGKH